MMFKPD